MAEKNNLPEPDTMAVKTELPGYWSLSPKQRKRVDGMLEKLIKSRDAGEEGAEDEQEGPVQ